MSRRERILNQLRVEPGTPAGLSGRDTAWTGGKEFKQLSEKKRNAAAKDTLRQGVKELSDVQELLWASDTYAPLVVFQALDATGKDSTIEHVMSGVNPQGVQVVSFGKPSSEELDHDFLWRFNDATPRTRTHRHLQPVPLRGGRRAVGSPRVAGQPEASSRPARHAVLEGEVRGHQRVRAPPRPERHEECEVLPSRLEG